MDLVLREDALTRADGGGFALRIALPWMRSLPIASLSGIRVEIDGELIDDLRVDLGDHVVDPVALAELGGWWFLQDRLVLVGSRRLADGEHDVSVGFELAIPYFSTPDGPVVLPQSSTRRLLLDQRAAPPTVSRDVTQTIISGAS